MYLLLLLVLNYPNLTDEKSNFLKTKIFHGKNQSIEMEISSTSSAVLLKRNFLLGLFSDKF